VIFPAVLVNLFYSTYRLIIESMADVKRLGIPSSTFWGQFCTECAQCRADNIGQLKSAIKENSGNPDRNSEVTSSHKIAFVFSTCVWSFINFKINNMNESIYNLIPPDYKAPVKGPMHKSKHDPQAPLTGSTFG
jgi:hypothetical protein